MDMKTQFLDYSGLMEDVNLIKNVLQTIKKFFLMLLYDHSPKLEMKIVFILTYLQVYFTVGVLIVSNTYYLVVNQLKKFQLNLEAQMEQLNLL